MPTEIDTKATAKALLKELHEEENATSPRAATLHDQAFAGKWKQLSADQRKAVEAEMKSQEAAFETVYPNSKVTFNDTNGEIDVSVKGKTHAAFKDSSAAAGPTPHTDGATAAHDAAAKQAAKEAQEKAEAQRKEQEKVEATTKDLLTKLHNNNTSGFNSEYNALSPEEKAQVAKQMKLENQDPSLRISLDMKDGTLASVSRGSAPNNQYLFINAGEFENAARDSHQAKALSDYYKSLPADDQEQFKKDLSAAAPDHGVSIKFDKDGNPQVFDVNGKHKFWPQSGFGNILHGVEDKARIPH